MSWEAKCVSAELMLKWLRLKCALISIAEIVSAHASGKIASLITVESGHSIGTSLAVLRMFHRLGARSLTLTHNCNTPWYVSNS